MIDRVSLLFVVTGTLALSNTYPQAPAHELVRHFSNPLEMCTEYEGVRKNLREHYGELTSVMAPPISEIMQRVEELHLHSPGNNITFSKVYDAMEMYQGRFATDDEYGNFTQAKLAMTARVGGYACELASLFAKYLIDYRQRDKSTRIHEIDVPRSPLRDLLWAATQGGLSMLNVLHTMRPLRLTDSPLSERVRNYELRDIIPVHKEKEDYNHFVNSGVGIVVGIMAGLVISGFLANDFFICCDLDGDDEEDEDVEDEVVSHRVGRRRQRIPLATIGEEEIPLPSRARRESEDDVYL